MLPHTDGSNEIWTKVWRWIDIRALTCAWEKTIAALKSWIELLCDLRNMTIQLEITYPYPQRVCSPQLEPTAPPHQERERKGGPDGPKWPGFGGTRSTQAPSKHTPTLDSGTGELREGRKGERDHASTAATAVLAPVPMSRPAPLRWGMGRSSGVAAIMEVDAREGVGAWDDRALVGFRWRRATGFGLAKFERNFDKGGEFCLATES
jgi:hypothetical protein